MAEFPINFLEQDIRELVIRWAEEFEQENLIKAIEFVCNGVYTRQGKASPKYGIGLKIFLQLLLRACDPKLFIQSIPHLRNSVTWPNSQLPFLSFPFLSLPLPSSSS